MDTPNKVDNNPSNSTSKLQELLLLSTSKTWVSPQLEQWQTEEIGLKGGAFNDGGLKTYSIV